MANMNSFKGGPTKPKSEKVGRWFLWVGGPNGPQVLLDHAGYPPEVKGGEVRLVVNDDIGVWYAKIK